MNKEISKIYLINILKDFNLIVVYLAPLMKINMMTAAEIVLVISIFRITQSVLGVPIGYIADKIGSELVRGKIDKNQQKYKKN